MNWTIRTWLTDMLILVGIAITIDGSGKASFLWLVPGFVLISIGLHRIRGEKNV